MGHHQGNAQSWRGCNAAGSKEAHAIHVGALYCSGWQPHTCGSAMTQSEVTTARIIFYVAAIANVIYGLLFLSMPERVFELSQDPGVPPGWVLGVARFSSA